MKLLILCIALASAKFAVCFSSSNEFNKTELEKIYAEAEYFILKLPEDSYTRKKLQESEKDLKNGVLEFREHPSLHLEFEIKEMINDLERLLETVEKIITYPPNTSTEPSTETTTDHQTTYPPNKSTEPRTETTTDHQTTTNPIPIKFKCPPKIGDSCSCYPSEATIICSNLDQFFISEKLKVSKFIIENNQDEHLETPSNFSELVVIEHLIIRNCKFQTIDFTILGLDGLKSLQIIDNHQLVLNISSLSLELSYFYLENVKQIVEIEALDNLNQLQTLVIRNVSGFNQKNGLEFNGLDSLKQISIVQTDLNGKFSLKSSSAKSLEIDLKQNHHLNDLGLSAMENIPEISINLSDNVNFNPNFLLDNLDLITKRSANNTLAIRLRNTLCNCDCDFYKFVYKRRLRLGLSLFNVYCQDTRQFLKYLDC